MVDRRCPEVGGYDMVDRRCPEVGGYMKRTVQFMGNDGVGDQRCHTEQHRKVDGQKHGNNHTGFAADGEIMRDS